MQKHGLNFAANAVEEPEERWATRVLRFFWFPYEELIDEEPLATSSKILQVTKTSENKEIPLLAMLEHSRLPDMDPSRKVNIDVKMMKVA